MKNAMYHRLSPISDVDSASQADCTCSPGCQQQRMINSISAGLDTWMGRQLPRHFDHGDGVELLQYWRARNCPTLMTGFM